MSRLIAFEVQSFAAARVIGRPVTCSLKPGAPNPIPQLWESMIEDGSLEFLTHLPERATADPDQVGWMGNFNAETMEFTCIAGVLTHPGTPVPEGYTFRDLPDCTMGIGWIEGTQEGGDLYMRTHELTHQAMQENGYAYDPSAGGFEMEYYSHEKFVVPMEKGEKLLVLGYYSPCKQAK